MFTLDIKLKRSRQALKTLIFYSAVTLFCITFDNIYALFGHGVYSSAMSLMFLYPLLGGVLPYLLLWLFVPGADKVRHYRFIYNCFNSGIALLTIASCLRGIFEIAGTASVYMIIYYICGGVMVSIGLSAYLLNLGSRKLEI